MKSAWYQEVWYCHCLFPALHLFILSFFIFLSPFNTSSSLVLFQVGCDSLRWDSVFSSRKWSNLSLSLPHPYSQPSFQHLIISSTSVSHYSISVVTFWGWFAYFCEYFECVCRCLGFLIDVSIRFHECLDGVCGHLFFGGCFCFYLWICVHFDSICGCAARVTLCFVLIFLSLQPVSIWRNFNLLFVSLRCFFSVLSFCMILCLFVVIFVHLCCNFVSLCERFGFVCQS